MKRPRWSLITVSTVALAMLAVGCSSSTGGADGPVLTSPRPSPLGPEGGMAAEVTGVLTFDEDENCLRMELEGVAYPLIWPAGTRWLDDPPAVVLANGDRVEPGMTVYGGGGYLSTAHVEDSAGPAVAAAAQRCVGPSGEVAFFNVGSEVEVIEPRNDG